VAVVKHHQLAGIEEVDRGTSLALRYMKQLVERGAVTPKPERLVATAG
jgi:hypothetical protein